MKLLLGIKTAIKIYLYKLFCNTWVSWWQSHHNYQSVNL